MLFEMIFERVRSRIHFAAFFAHKMTRVMLIHMQFNLGTIWEFTFTIVTIVNPKNNKQI